MASRLPYGRNRIGFCTVWGENSTLHPLWQLSGISTRFKLIAREGEGLWRFDLESEQAHCAIPLFVNDCAPALRALQKGSSKPNLQAAAEQLDSGCIKAGQFPMCLHVSGETTDRVRKLAA